jgi:hypothetical protein
MNEKTSKRVASVAGRISRRLGTLKAIEDAGVWVAVFPAGEEELQFVKVASLAELRAMAASLMTQAPDKKL